MKTIQSIKEGSEDAKNLINYMMDLRRKHNNTFIEKKNDRTSVVSPYRTLTTFKPNTKHTIQQTNHGLFYKCRSRPQSSSIKS